MIPHHIIRSSYHFLLLGLDFGKNMAHNVIQGGKVTLDIVDGHLKVVDVVGAHQVAGWEGGGDHFAEKGGTG